MEWAIPRYGARVPPETREIVKACRDRGELVRGPHIEEFETAFARRFGAEEAIATSFGRMAFYWILRAFQFPPGSEIIFPAITFWVMPELARVAGLTPVFADVDPRTSTIDPRSFDSKLTDRTCAVVPTHLYGLPCDMAEVLAISHRRGLVVIEDCAHSTGARYRGEAVGALGDAALFSFQLLKPLTTFGGGMAIVRDRTVLARVRELIARETRVPAVSAVRRRLLLGKLQHTFTRPGVFTFSGFPVLWGSSFLGAKPDSYLWEAIRPLDVFPASYSERYSNVQAAIGLAALDHIDRWTQSAQRHAAYLSAVLAPLASVPFVPPDRTHVYYQYCLQVPDRERFVKEAIRRGLDVETLHMDLCSELPLFNSFRADTPSARAAIGAVQLPVHPSLSDAEIGRVAAIARAALTPIPRRIYAA